MCIAVYTVDLFAVAKLPIFEINLLDYFHASLEVYVFFEKFENKN